MYSKMNDKICRRFGIKPKVMPSLSSSGFIVDIDTVYPNLCEGENIKHLLRIINKYKKTHKIKYDGDTKELLEKICGMRLTKQVEYDITNDMRGVNWWN